MAEADWTYLNDGLDIATVDRGVTAGIARPPGGGSFLFAFNSLAAIQGAVGLFCNLVDFAPMAKGASIRGTRPPPREEAGCATLRTYPHRQAYPWEG